MNRVECLFLVDKSYDSKGNTGSFSKAIRHIRDNYDKYLVKANPNPFNTVTFQNSGIFSEPLETKPEVYKINFFLTDINDPTMSGHDNLMNLGKKIYSEIKEILGHRLNESYYKPDI